MKVHVDPHIRDTYRVFPAEGRGAYLRYDMNENPEGLPAAFVQRVLREITPEFLATYPEPSRFLGKYAAFLSVQPENLLAVNGSDMAIRLGASYKGFFFNAVFQGEFGYKKNIPEYYSLENNSLQRFQQYHLNDTWTPENPNAEYPRIKYATSSDNNRKTSTFWVRNCNFLRLKTLNVGYQFPQKILNKAHLSSASIALQGSNLFTITDLVDMDPEQTSRGYPITRTYGITLNLGF